MKAKRLRLRWGILKNRIDVALSSKQQSSDARFAHLYELAPLLGDRVDRPSLNIGVGPYFHPLRVEQSAKHRELGNILLDASTRRGKGQAGKCQILTWEGPVVVNDIKRDYWDDTAGYRNERGPVFRFDPTGYGNRYDPTIHMTTEDDLYDIAKYLLYDPKENQPVFTERAIKMLTQMFLGAVAKVKPKFPYIRDMIDFGPRFTAEKLYAIPHVGPTLAAKFLDVPYEKADWGSKFLNDCWATLTAKMYPLTLPNVLKSISGSDFTAKQILQSKRPATLYLCWPERKLNALAPLIRLVWSTLIDEMIDTYDQVKGKGCYPTLYLFDEAGRCPVPNLPDYTSTVAGRNISFWIAYQSPSQMEEQYGTFGADIIQDNMDTKIYYRPASRKAANSLEDDLGEKTEWNHSRTDHHGIKASEGVSEKAVALMTAQAIRGLKEEEILVRHRDLWPFKAFRMKPSLFPELERRTHIKPPPVKALPELDEKMYDLSPHQLITSHIPPHRSTPSHIPLQFPIFNSAFARLHSTNPHSRPNPPEDATVLTP